VSRPNEMYQQSTLLFWTITYVGSRRYKKDVTLHSRLGPLVIDFAFVSFGSEKKSLSTIVAAIVLCNWPPPIDIALKDPCPALAGAALNLAIQNGLHMYHQEQEDFYALHKQPSNTFSWPSTEMAPFSLGTQDSALIYRAQIWAYSVVTFQRYALRITPLTCLLAADCCSSSLCEGLPPLALPFHRKDEDSKLTDKLAYRVRIHRIMVKATLAIADIFDLGGNNEDTTISTTILAFDQQLQGTHYRSDNDQSKFFSRFLYSAIYTYG
jgi:hypothetical protein